MLTQNLKINTAKKGLCEIVPCVQADSGRNLSCVVTDMIIPTGSAARIYAIKPSGFEIYNDCIIEGNKIKVKLTTQMLAEEGSVPCQVEVTSKEQTVTSFKFILSVQKCMKGAGSIESSNEFTALENALAQVNEIETPKFTEATTRENIESGETFSVLFGKIKKYFTDLGNSAFKSVSNELSTSAPGFVLDARQGKELSDEIYKTNSNLNNSRSAYGKTILKDALTGIGMGEPFGENKNPQRVVAGTTAQIPADCSWGIRTIQIFNANQCIIEIIGGDNTGAISKWVNAYFLSTNKWLGWKKVY